MTNPLESWSSEAVRELLKDQYKSNFELANIASSFAVEIVDLAWNARNSKDIDNFRSQIHTKYQEAKNHAVFNSKEIYPIDLINFSKVNSFLDVGANKLDVINYVAKKYKNINTFIAIDVIPQRSQFHSPQKSFYYHTDPEANKFPIENNSVDFINIQFVLHHFPDKQSIERMLNNCKLALKPGGKLLLWEETFEDNVDASELARSNNVINIMTDPDLTNRFYNLSEKEKWEFISVNDWIINVGNNHMQWTDMYFKWGEWVELLKQYGFELEKKYNLGLRISGKLKQGVHILGLFSVTK